jgi:hypothetical protein
MPVGMSCDDGDPCTVSGTCLMNGTSIECQNVGPAIVVTGTTSVFKGGVIHESVLLDNEGGFIRLFPGTYMADGTMISANRIRSFKNVDVYNVRANVLSGLPMTIRCEGEFPDPPDGCEVDDPFVPNGAGQFCALPVPPVDACASGAPQRLPEGVTVLDLPPGTYGDITLKAGATLDLTEGEYDICTIRAARDVSINVKAGAPGSPAPVLRIARFIRARRNFTLAPTGAAARPTVYVGEKFSVAREASIKAHLVSPNGLVRFLRLADFDGTICAIRLILFRESLFRCDP